MRRVVISIELGNARSPHKTNYPKCEKKNNRQRRDQYVLQSRSSLPNTGIPSVEISVFACAMGIGLPPRRVVYHLHGL
jgi:hypothetical protein